VFHGDAMVLLVPLRQLGLLIGEDISLLPHSELIERISNLFSFLGPIDGVEVKGDTALIHTRETPPSKATEAARLAERAAKRAQTGDYARAVELLRRALGQDPSLPTAHRDLAMSLMELGKHAEAKDALIDALKLDATDAWSFVVLGNLYAKHENDFARARQFFERALELKPGDAWALNGLAASLVETGDHAGALRRFDEAIASNPDFANAWLGKAMLLLRSSHASDATATVRAMFARAKMQDARSEPVFAEASKVFLSAETELARAGESDAFKAVEDYRHVVEQDSGYPVEVVEDALPGGLAGRAQMAWKHHRDRHIVTVRKSPPKHLRYLSRRTSLRTS